MALIRVRTVWGLSQGGPGLTTMWGLPADTTVATIQACVDAIRDFWTTNSTHIGVGNSWTVNGLVDVIDAATGLITSQQVVLSRSGAGSLSGDAMPGMVQGLVHLATGVFSAGRQIVGSVHIPGAVETDNSATGTPTSGYVTALQLACNTLAGVAAFKWAAYSRVHHLAVNPVSPLARGTWAVLRSRRS